MFKRIEHIGVIVDSLDEAKSFLEKLGMQLERDVELPGRLKSAFYLCGQTAIEAIEVIEPGERRMRLGQNQARIEHIALEVDDLGATVDALGGLGIKLISAEPLDVGDTRNLWTTPETCDGVMYQLVQKGKA